VDFRRSYKISEVRYSFRQINIATKNTESTETGR
jgi:hypothetical protein